MTKIKVFLFSGLIFILSFATCLAQQKEAFRLKTVVIDPGHGGRDPGSTHGNYYEKDIVLDIALKLGKKIKSSFPGVKVVYTRDRDIFVPLSSRGKIANKAKGDLFISIHVNSVKSSQARGVETFTIGMHKNAANLAVAKKENSVITLENGYEQTYEGFDPNNEESYIMFSLGQHAFQRRSLSLSYEVQQRFSKYLPTIDRGMKQAGFLVLWTASMPSILTEVGFISNREDRKYLCNDRGRNIIVKALYEAFVGYKKSVEVVSHYDIASDSDVYYSVQFFASGKKRNFKESKYRILNKDLEVRRAGRVYKYYAGKSKSNKEILSLHLKVKKLGFKDAFVVAFKNGKQISVSEARRLLK